ncbi:Mur ligase [Emericellopsis atlantica]|uniref:tetrahydrofolate synthase n=1 Tax=Emericellopsis atlantica TaxID=2614577 RepID=A0A9P7ZPY4_9HYPO|nr:Mur ligase [Emericellopsis atlantica]KAG9255941.1 Mur ligase [Emericellopsis atlantica]
MPSRSLTSPRVLARHIVSSSHTCQNLRCAALNGDAAKRPLHSCQHFRRTGFEEKHSITNEPRHGTSFKAAVRHWSSGTREAKGRTYSDALERLDSLTQNRDITKAFDGKDSKAANEAAIPEMITWLRRAGYTTDQLSQMQHIHVAGTKGKGTVCAYATRLLLNGTQGKRVGTYTSPHLVTVRERIALDGSPVSKQLFTEAFFELWDRLGEAAQREGLPEREARPFFFRFMTLLAWHIFIREKVDVVVMECGIGGEYDATNILPPAAVATAVITHLELDHTAMLGNTVESIAWHKSGIFKQGRPAIAYAGDMAESVKNVLVQRAKEKGANLYLIPKEVLDRVCKQSPDDVIAVKNHMLADMAVIAQQQGLSTKSISEYSSQSGGDLPQAWEKMHVPGRGEVLQMDGKTWYLDGAHTQDSIANVASWIAAHVSGNDKLIVIFNQQERDAVQLLKHLVRSVESYTDEPSWWTSKSPSFIFPRNNLMVQTNNELKQGARDLSVQEEASRWVRSPDGAKLMSTKAQITVLDNVNDAVAQAKEIAAGHSKAKIVVTGSMYLVGAVLKTLQRGTGDEIE